MDRRKKVPDAESLTTEIKDKLNTFGLTLQNCRGQGYDGAATMIGRLNGVGARIQRDESTAITALFGPQS